MSIPNIPCASLSFFILYHHPPVTTHHRHHKPPTCSWCQNQLLMTNTAYEHHQPLPPASIKGNFILFKIISVEFFFSKNENWFTCLPTKIRFSHDMSQHSFTSVSLQVTNVTTAMNTTSM